MSEQREKYYTTGVFSGTTFLTLGVLLTIIGLAVYSWLQQLSIGLGVTGLNRPAVWGIYMANFVFFISISMSGTFISAVMRLLNLEWGKPITRVAEVITVASLVMAALNILFDVGQPFRALIYIPLFGRIQSPVGWDVIVLLFYLLTSLGYLHISLIPDAAVLSERETRLSWLYRLLRYDWSGAEHQVHLLESALKILAVVTIPIAVMMHTVTGWIFGGMKAVPTWNDALFGPYFIIGALLSGLSLIIITAAVIRERYRLQEIMSEKAFTNLGKILVVFLLGYLYFFLAENFTVRYAAAAEDFHVSEFLWTGPYSPFTWYILVSLVVPSIVLLIPSLRSYRTVVAMAGVVLPAMWVKRVLIVVPGLLNQTRLPTVQGPVADYAPTHVELLLTAGSFAGLALVLLLFTKLFPTFPVWEIFGHTKTREEPASRISLRAVFTGWMSGISVSSAFVFAWAVATLTLGEKAATSYSVKLMPTSVEVLVTPELVTSSMINLLSVVVLAGILAILLVREG
ncbi:Menaquinone reductase, integral membrane subunit [Candidatus Calditenuaceae archaeon HR02]|nr:Menaquinone reductase, integral membrane subunit [Candidatus Calditenuaceae archaeon HR02]